MKVLRVMAVLTAAAFIAVIPGQAIAAPAAELEASHVHDVRTLARPTVKPSDSYYTSIVKDSYIKACKSATVGEMADAFFGYPYWDDFTSTSGKRVVEVEGEMTYKNRPVTATIQFVVKPSGNFRATYLGFNGKAQSILMLSALFKKMCQSS